MITKPIKINISLEAHFNDGIEGVRNDKTFRRKVNRAEMIFLNNIVTPFVLKKPFRNNSKMKQEKKLETIKIFNNYGKTNLKKSKSLTVDGNDIIISIYLFNNKL